MSHDNQNSYERFIAAAEAYGLTVRETQRGVTARIQTPGHSPTDDGIAITYNGSQTLAYCHNGDISDVLAELGLSYSDLYDASNHVEYRYPDSRVVFRKIDKKGFTQRGNTKGSTLYGSDKIKDTGVIYVVEGEKDVQTIQAVWGANAVTQAQGASTAPSKADWTSLSDRDVIVIADKDEPGYKRATKVLEHLNSLQTPPATVKVVEAAVGKDVSDHIAAGKTSEELLAVNELPAERRITLVPASSVKTERLDWLVENWIPKRSLTLLAGREGLGKSTIACGIAAQATRGELNAPPMNVAYLNTEDSRSITVKPRLQAAGADLDRVFFIDVTGDTGKESSLRLPDDTIILERALVRHNVKFVVLDAAKSAMSPKLDGYRDDDVREFLEPLAAMADRNDIAILGLAHFGKRESSDTGKLLLGSIAWSQVARSVLSVAADEEGTLVVTNTKGNLAPRVISREATLQSVAIPTDDGQISDVAKVIWGDETTRSAAELLVTKDDTDDDLNELEAFLLSYFQDCTEAKRADVIGAAQKEKLGSESTIKRTFKRLGGVSERKGFPSIAMWSLPSCSQVSQPIDATHACVGDPTDPTGDNQGKRIDPTGTNTQSVHVHENDPTDELAEEIEGMIVNSLSIEYGLSESIVLGSVPTKIASKDVVKSILDDLVTSGKVVLDSRGRFVKAREVAA